MQFSVDEGLTLIGMLANGAFFLWLQWRTSNRQTARDEKEDAAEDKKTATAIARIETTLGELKEAVGRAFDELMTLRESFQSHEVECANERGQITASMASMATTQERQARALDGINAKFQLRSGLDHNKAVELPASGAKP